MEGNGSSAFRECKKTLKNRKKTEARERENNYPGEKPGQEYIFFKYVEAMLFMPSVLRNQ